MHGHTKQIRCVRFTVDGNLVVSGGDDGSIIIWDRYTGTVRNKLSSWLKSVHAIAIHPDGKRLLAPWRYALTVLDSPDRLRFWDLETGKPCEVEREEGAEASMWHRAEMLAKGPEIFEIVIDDAMNLMDLAFLQSGQSYVMLMKHGRPEWRQLSLESERYDCWFDRRFGVSAISLSADGTTAAVASKHYARVGKLDAKIVPPAYHVKSMVSSIALSPLADTLVGSWENQVTVWSTDQADVVHQFSAHDAPVNKVAFSPDGSMVASAGQDGLVLIWEPLQGIVRAKYDWNLGTIQDLAFSPDGLNLAVAGQGGLILFDLE